MTITRSILDQLTSFLNSRDVIATGKRRCPRRQPENIAIVSTGRLLFPSFRINPHY